MYKNAKIDIYERTLQANSEGTPIETWAASPIDSFKADAQPKVLSSSELQAYGIDESKANVLVLFCRNRTSIKPNSRAFVRMQGGGNPQFYTVMPLNYWPHHIEVLLIPIIGEEPIIEYSMVYSALGADSGSAPIDPNLYTEGANITVLGNSGNLAKVGYDFVGWTLVQL